CKEDRREDAERAERQLEDDRVGDVLVGLRCDRSRSVERDVRGEAREHAESHQRALRADVLAARLRQRVDGPSGQVCAARCDEVVDELLLLLDLRANGGRGLPFDLNVVVVAFHGRRRAAVQKGLCALREEDAGTRRVGARTVTHEEKLGNVALGERPLARCDLDDCGAVPRLSGRPDRDHRACGEDEGEGADDRDDRAAPTLGERTKLPTGQRHCAISSECMPAMKCPYMLQSRRYRPGGRLTRKSRTAPARAGSSPPTVCFVSASSLTVMPSARSGRCPLSCTTISSCASGPWFVMRKRVSPAGTRWVESVIWKSCSCTATTWPPPTGAGPRARSASATPAAARTLVTRTSAPTIPSLMLTGHLSGATGPTLSVIALNDVAECSRHAGIRDEPEQRDGDEQRDGGDRHHEREAERDHVGRER